MTTDRPPTAHLAWFGILLVCAIGSPALAKDGVLPPPDGAVAAALQAATKGDTVALKALTEDTNSDPWWTAHELCVRGETAAARAFAEAATRQDLAPLANYVRMQVRRRPSADAWSHVLAIEKLSHVKAWYDLVTYAEENRLDTSTRDVAGAIVSLMVGVAQLRLDRAEQALEGLSQAADRADELGWYRGVTIALDGVFEAATSRRRFREMVSAKERLAEIHRKAGDRKAAAIALINVGSVHGAMASFGHAVEQFESILRQYDDVLTPVMRAHTLCNAGLANSSIGDYTKAQVQCWRAIEIAKDAELTEYLAVAHMTLGTIAVELGDKAGALLHIGTARTLFEKIDDGLGVAEAIGNLAWFEMLHGDRDVAMEQMQQALALYEELGHDVYAARARANIAHLIGVGGDLPRAMRKLNAARRELEALGDKESLADVISSLAQFSQQGGNLQRTLGYREEQYELAESTGSFDLESKALTGIASAHLARGEFAEALEHTDRAMDVMGLQFDRLPVGQAAIARHRVADAAEIGLTAALALASIDDVCRYLEAGRAGALITRLEGRREIRTVRIDEEISKREIAARREVALARIEYRDARESGKRASARVARQRWEAAKTELQAAIARIQLEGGLAADLLYPSPASREEIQDALEPGEALVMYGTTEAGLSALVLTPDTERIVRLAPMAEVVAVCDGMLAATSSADRPCDPTPLRALVTDPLELPDTVRRVIVSPTGVLSYQSPALLFPDHEVAAVASGTVLTRLERATSTPGRVLALGNPDYSLRSSGSSTAPADMPTAPVLRGRVLAPIPASGEEAKAVGDTVLVGGDATETNLRAALEKGGPWRSVHLACHCFLDEDRPGSSVLALAPTEEDDGELLALDVYQIRVPADLVVLSACESGRGELHRAEGLFGFTSAFMVAGAPKVIVSLWRVDDAATEALMTKFYELWNPRPDRAGGPDGAERVEGSKDGPEVAPPEPLGAAAALKAAQAHVRSHEAWKHPYYWAAWVLWGTPN